MSSGKSLFRLHLIRSFWYRAHAFPMQVVFTASMTLTIMMGGCTSADCQTALEGSTVNESSNSVRRDIRSLERRVEDLETVIVQLQAELIRQKAAGDGASDALTKDGVPLGESPCFPKSGLQQLTDRIWRIEPNKTGAIFTPTCLNRQARFTVSYRRRRPIGLRIYEIRPGSWPDVLGLQNGDIIKSVNGRDIRSKAAAIGLFEELAQEATLELVLSRRGRLVTYQYRIYDDS